jgi:prepilin-type N-terminal cleavage/methylation domain-containing protein
VRKRSSGFTLIELLTVIVLLLLFSMFLAKLNFSSSESGQVLKLAAKTLAESLDSVRSQAIANNTDACMLIDTGSSYKFRRLILCRKDIASNWIPKHIMFLPEKFFVLPQSTLSEYLNEDLSESPYVEEEFIINGNSVSGYSFVFNNRGKLCNLARNTALIAVANGTKDGDDILFDNNSNPIGIFILPQGRQIILESKNAMKEVL